ncbi:MAG: bifunctional riboflavin kinase/FAD synthetase [Sandaracinaceae bacterium]|nr:bifunctional riboflavin kinase/FAD synthetase [Sandaracinaceae bacterium]
MNPSAAKIAGEGSVALPGNYDGVHLGHQALLAAARMHAARLASRVVVLTFDPHPLQLLAPERAPKQLTTRERRAQLLRLAGADDVRVVRFDEDFAKQSPTDFVDSILVKELRARAIVVGSDFRFGEGRAGDLPMLRSLGETRNFSVEEVAPVIDDGSIVSSTRVRQCLENGEVREAARLLSRAHDVDGTVVEGNRRGRTIGFPTANLQCDPVLLPRDGVYMIAARVLDDARVVPGVLNIGTRPTLAAGRSFEAHLFDFDRDIYGKRLRVAFLERLRDEKKFDGIDSLTAQIQSDVALAKEAWANTPMGLVQWM